MPGEAEAVGAMAKLANTVASWFMSEGGYAEYKKKSALAAKKKEGILALQNHDFVRLRIIIGELERMSSSS